MKDPRCKYSMTVHVFFLRLPSFLDHLFTKILDFCVPFVRNSLKVGTIRGYVTDKVGRPE